MAVIRREKATPAAATFKNNLTRVPLCFLLTRTRCAPGASDDTEIA